MLILKLGVSNYFVLEKQMPFLLLLIALFVFALARGEDNAAFIILIMIVAALLATYWKPFRDSLKEHF